MPTSRLDAALSGGTLAISERELGLFRAGPTLAMLTAGSPAGPAGPAAGSREDQHVS
jgi:hypothetical protein